MIYIFLKDNSKIEKKMFFKNNDNDLFIISFVLGGKVNFNPEQLNGSHEAIIIYKIEAFIADNIYTDNELQIVFNYDNESSYKFFIYIESIKEIVLNSQMQEELAQQKIKKIEEKKLQLKNKNINKIYNIIYNNPDISTTELIQKTRFVKDPSERNYLVEKLVDEGKIMLEIDKSKGRLKKTYKAI